MSADVRPIEVGDRFESRDKRDAGRVVEVIEAIPGLASERESRLDRAKRLASNWGGAVAGHEEWLRQRETRFRIRTEAHPKNPDAIGNVSNVHEGTLRAKYRRVSR